MDENDSIWKKEISFKRKPKEPKPPKEAKESVWKKEISFKRKAKVEEAPPAPPPPTATPADPPPAAEPALVDLDWLTASLDALAAGEAPPPVAPPVAAAPPAAAEAPAPAPEAAAAQPKTSVLKKEISFKRKPKEPKAEKPKREKPPKQEKPKRERKAKAAKAEKAPAAAPQKKRENTSKLPKRLVGLKIGASQLAAARVVNNGHAQVEQVAREALDPGIVVAGELREPDALANALRAFFKKHKLPKRGVRLGIANNRIGVRIFEIAGIEDPKQLANAIRFRAQEALPIPIEEAVLDYHIREESRDEEGHATAKVLLFVAYRELIDRYVTACRKAGITLVGIDLEAFALLRSLAAPPEDEAQEPEAALVAIAVGHERSTFAVSDGRICEFTRVLDWGGGALDVAIARELDLTPSTAEPIKRSLSLYAKAHEPPEGLTEEQAARATEAVRRQVQTFARELVSSLQFYQNQPGSLGIGEIVLTGGTAHLDGLADELQRMIGVAVRVGDPLARVAVSKRIKEPEQVGSLAIAIGLGIED